MNHINAFKTMKMIELTSREVADAVKHSTVVEL